jgi:hypothetical protein
MPFLRTLPAIALLILAIAAASYFGGEKAFSPSAGQDRLSNEVAAPLVDHHQHLLSPAGAELINALGHKEKPVTGEQLVGMLDAAGIHAKVKELMQGGLACDQAKTRRTCENLLKHDISLWTFVREEEVEPTNNNAEVRFVGQKPSLHKSGDWPQVERRPLLTT